MSTHPEDLEKGDWIVITWYYHFSEYRDDEKGVLARPSYNGEPMQLAGKGLPFLAVETIHGGVDTVDVRDYAVQKVTDEYVEAFLEPLDAPEPAGEARVAIPRMMCPLCAAKLSERRTGPGKWVLACECGLRATTDAEKELS